MRQLPIIFLLIFAACSAGPKMVSMSSYYDIPIGATREEVITQAGDPFNVTKKNDGSEEYEYVERMSVGGRLLQERRYIITLKDGVVISKRLEQNSPSPNRFDSYEMQTTQNDGH